MVDVTPHPKPAPRKPGRAFRMKATRREWEALRASKLGPCRVCGAEWGNELHHLVNRSQGGHDVADNLVPLGNGCHWAVTTRDSVALQALHSNLTEAERSYLAESLGVDWARRAFGV